MTLPSTGSISMSQVSSEIGNPANASMNMAWIRDNSKAGAVSLAAIYGMAWYQRNVDGNCNNGNCTANCNCGSNCVGATSNCGFGITPNCNCTALNCNAVNCANCLACANVNCTNCDGRAWLQGNCNCACTYNCNTTDVVSVNCSGVNCNCSTACDCNCTPPPNCTNCSNCGSCWLPGTLILMADLTWKRVDHLSIGDMLMGANGKPARLIQIESPTISTRRVYEMPDAITGTRMVRWTEEHRYRVRNPETGVNNWWVASVFEKIYERYLARTHKVMGTYEHVTSRKLIDGTWSGPGFEFESIAGYKSVDDLMVDVTDKYSPGTRVYDVVTDTGTPIVIEGFIASGYTPDDFQFTTHQIEPQHVLTATRNFEAGQGVRPLEEAA